MTNVLDEAVAGKGLETAFQQVVQLAGGIVVGYEALARWPGAQCVAPLDIIAHAEKTGHLNRLDRACVRAAARGALRGNATPGMLLLVNSEPATVWADMSEDVDVSRAAEVFHLAVEITERGLLTDPQTLLRKVAALRASGIAIALDDIGAHPDSLALLDVVAPDIVKLDIGLVQRRPDRMHAHTIAAIQAYRDRTGALICAEGIETEQHLEQALAYGATLGQGFMFAPPGELTVRPTPFSWSPPKVGIRAPFDADADAEVTIFDIVAAGQVMRTVTKHTLNELVDDVQRRAMKAEIAPIVLSALRGDPIGEPTRRRYRSLAQASPLVAVFGQDVPAELGDGVRRIRLDPGDPLSLEFAIVALGPETAVGLVAREHVSARGLPTGAGDQLFDVVFTFDRDRTATVVRSLLDRPPPTISIHMDSQRRKLACCTCGWRAKSRRLRFMAVGDAANHRTETGHLPVEERAG